jgi:predicted nucleic acid-binding protein
MVARRLPDIPAGRDVFIDANILIHAIAKRSAQCHEFLVRCSKEEVFGVCLLETINNATHLLMLAEAVEKRLIEKPLAKQLKRKPEVVRSLTDYWEGTERLLRLNLTLVPISEQTVREAQSDRVSAGLLTNDSMIVAEMRNLGIQALASHDQDFERVTGIELFSPDDVTLD